MSIKSIYVITQIRSTRQNLPLFQYRAETLNTCRVDRFRKTLLMPRMTLPSDDKTYICARLLIRIISNLMLRERYLYKNGFLCQSKLGSRLLQLWH